MIILLKSFFRKKKTKIYLFLISFMVFIIVTLFSFVSYYKQLVNQKFEENSILLMVSQNDHFDKFNQYDNITKVERTLLFVPNTDYDILNSEKYAIYDANGKLVSSNLSDNSVKVETVNWQDFMVAGFDCIMVVSNKNTDILLNDNELALSFNFARVSKEKYLKDLIDEKIGFYFNNSNVEFSIRNVYKTKYEEIMISEETFQKLFEENTLYSYRLTINDYQKVDELKKELSKLENSEEFTLSLYETYSDDNNIDQLKRVVDIIQLVSYLIIVVFVLIIFVILKNIINDEAKNVHTEKLLGYSNGIIKKKIIFELIILSLICSIITVGLSTITNYILNMCFKYELIIFNVSKIFGSYLILSIVIIILVISLNLKKLQKN